MLHLFRHRHSTNHPGRQAATYSARQSPSQAASHLINQAPRQPASRASGAVRWRRQASRAVTGRAPSQPASRAVKRRSQKNFPSRAVKILAQRNFRISSHAVKILAPRHPSQSVDCLTALRFLREVKFSRMRADPGPLKPHFEGSSTGYPNRIICLVWDGLGVVVT